MVEIRLDSLRHSLEGVIPAFLATLDRTGIPNVSLISQVHFVDQHHVALSYQFFNKTRRNLLETGMAQVQIIDPLSFAQHRLTLDFVETQTSGPIFESMRAKLAGIASHTGMSGVFKLLGADIFRVSEIESVPVTTSRETRAAVDFLSITRRCFQVLAKASDLHALIDALVDCIVEEFGLTHVILLVNDRQEQRLTTLATRGYEKSGVGSEVVFGEGVIGVCARERIPIRIGHMTSEYRYGAAVRGSLSVNDPDWEALREVPFPGLPDPASQIAVPIMVDDELFGVLFSESPTTMRFWHEEEDALSIVASYTGALAARLRASETENDEPDLEHPAGHGAPLLVLRHFSRDDSVFLENEYLIKGVAGAILMHLIREHERTGRAEFTTRELRANTSLRLPELAENLDTRLILLRKRLVERAAPIRLDRCGRGRLRLILAPNMKIVVQSDVDVA